MLRRAQDGLLFASPRFDGFGPSRFHPEPLGGFCVRGRSAQLKLGVKKNTPKRPGVYAMLDPRHRIIYVGKAKCLRTRLSCYFRTESRDPKAARIIRQTRTLVWEYATCELGALLRELELIQRHRPRYNVLGLPGLRRYCWIALGRPTAPYAYVTREPSGKEQAIYGPFVGKSQVDAAVRRINDVYKLRDCAANFPMHFADDKPLFDIEKSAGCLRYELGTCLGPCGGGCTRRTYRAALKKAASFLDGTDRTLLDTLKKQMSTAAQAMQFEKAAFHRDRLHDLEWLDLRLALLRRSRHESAFMYPVVGDRDRTVWFLLNRGRIWGAVWAPQSDVECDSVADLLEMMLAEPATYPVTAKTVDSVLLIAAWFRKFAGEKEKLEPAEIVLARLRKQRVAA